jgi:hypothetical protein
VGIRGGGIYREEDRCAINQKEEVEKGKEAKEEYGKH